MSSPTSEELHIPVEQLESSVEPSPARARAQVRVTSLFILDSSVHDRYVVVKRKKSSPASPGLASTSDGEELIPKEDAVCQFCFKELGEEEVLKFICKCSSTLMHKGECVKKWSEQRKDNICVHCKEKRKEVVVTLSPALPELASAAAAANLQQNLATAVCVIT